MVLASKISVLPITLSNIYENIQALYNRFDNTSLRGSWRLVPKPNPANLSLAANLWDIGGLFYHTYINLSQLSNSQEWKSATSEQMHKLLDITLKATNLLQESGFNKLLASKLPRRHKIILPKIIEELAKLGQNVQFYIKNSDSFTPGQMQQMQQAISLQLIGILLIFSTLALAIKSPSFILPVLDSLNQNLWKLCEEASNSIQAVKEELLTGIAIDDEKRSVLKIDFNNLLPELAKFSLRKYMPSIIPNYIRQKLSSQPNDTKRAAGPAIVKAKL